MTANTVKAMHRRMSRITAIMLLWLCSCTCLGPKDGDDQPDDAADETSGDTGEPAKPADPEPQTETGAEQLSCEGELERLKAELAACQAATK